MSRLSEFQFSGGEKAMRRAPAFADQEVWAHCPTLDAFRKMVGAEIVNYRRAVVREHGERGYTRVIGSIKIRSGKVELEGIDVELSDADKDAIEREVAAADFPTSAPAPKNNLPSEIADAKPEHKCIFYDKTGEKILFAQLRRNGEKPDLPWSFWSDGVWRQMEPDHELPLYGLERLSRPHTVIIHEGAKGARDVQSLIDRGAPHPWSEQLRQAVHLGWPGGAPNARRVDWLPIKMLPPNVTIIIICDNDRPGLEAAAEISSILRRPLKVLRFDSNFPAGFDLADDWPKGESFWKEGKYIGPSFEDCLSSATWATQPKSREGKVKGRTTYVVRDQFAAEWIWVESPAVFVHVAQPHRIMDEDTFNRAVRPFSNVEKSSKLLMQHLASQAQGVTYSPGEREGIVIVEGRRLINTYRGATVIPTVGDAEPFLGFMTHLVPNDDDRRHLLKWVATLIAKPAIRMTYGVLLISQEQGVGKSTLGDILVELIGRWNVSFPSEQQVVDSQFNSWLVRKRLAIIHEIYAGHSFKAYNRLKYFITEKHVDVNEKYMPTYTLDNCIHIFACSNSIEALKLETDDRRWLIPRVSSKTLPKEYWIEFRAWLEAGGYGIIARWASDYVKGNGYVMPGEHAPSTSLKVEVIEEGWSEAHKFVADLALAIKKLETPVVISVEELRAYVFHEFKASSGARKPDSALSICKVLKAHGLKVPAFSSSNEVRRFTINGRKCSVAANFDIPSDQEWSDLKSNYLSISDVLTRCNISTPF